MHRTITRLILLAFVTMAPGAFAQGVTGSAVTGTVKKTNGQPIGGAALQLRNPATGDTFNGTSLANGRYTIDNVPAGGPYVLTSTAEGLEPTVITDLLLTLGQRLSLDVEMRNQLVEEIAVVARRDQNADRQRTGPSTIMKAGTITELPLFGRNFTSLAATDPRVVTIGDGISIAGQNNRFNNIQIDGGANNDLFGLSGNGTPGGNSNAKPIPLDAVQEFVVQIAPFDVRQGDFAGGLVNAITKSGTNNFHGGAFAYYQSKGLTNQNSLVNGQYIQDPNYHNYYQTQYGGFLGGPVIPDKVHFFIAADIQAREASFFSPLQLTGNDIADRNAVGFTQADVNRFVSILNKYGITNAGDASTPKLGNPNKNFFVKLDSNQIPNSRLELSYNYVNATQDVLSRDYGTISLPNNIAGGFELSNSGYGIANTTNTGRAKLTTNWEDSKFSNELLGGFSIIRDARSLANTAPLVMVKVGTQAGSATDAYLAAGAERFSQGNSLNQDIYQVQDTLTYSGEQHRVVFGATSEFFHFNNLFFQAKIGAWAFDSLDAFDAGTAVAFNHNVGLSTLQPAGTGIFSVAQPGVYVQDEYEVNEFLSLTGGLRVDIPFVGRGVTNPRVLNLSPLNIDTGRAPTGNPLWSPRMGFNWNVFGNSDTIVRGGLGVFSGRPPYVWVSNAFTRNALGQSLVVCSNPAFTFTADPNKQPTDCTGGLGIPTSTPPADEVDYFDKNTKYPQNLRFALGGDQRLPLGLLGSVDLLYTEDVNGWYTNDENLIASGFDGEGRALYGTVSGTPTTFTSRPRRVDTSIVNQAVVVYNKNGGKVYTASFQVQRPFLRRYSVSVAYTYSRSYDRISLTSSQALSNWRFEPVDGDLENRNVRPSAFDRPHKITITGTAALPYGFGAGLSYVGQSGTPYTWVVNGDINGDGQRTNDMPFIPANASQISLSGTPGVQASQYAALDAFIRSQSCLNDARGQMLQKGACRNPWNDYFDVRLTWTSPDWKGQRLEVQYDIFDVLNLINSSWGHYNEVTPFSTANVQFLRATGYDAVNRRPIYTVNIPSSISNTLYGPTQSRWRMQLGARYTF